MTKIGKAADAMTDLECHDFGLVAKVGGTWIDTALEQFRDDLNENRDTHVGG